MTVSYHLTKGQISPVVKVYSREIAEAKMEQTLTLAREAGHPLQCTMEPE